MKEFIVYKLLDLHFEESFFKAVKAGANYLHIGSFLPKEVEGAIEKVMDAYTDMMDVILNDPALDPQNKEVLKYRQWLRFSDYKKLYKRTLEFASLTNRTGLIVNAESRTEKEDLIQNQDPYASLDLPNKRKQELQSHFKKIDSPTPDTYFNALQHSGIDIARFFEKPLPLFITENSRKMHSQISGQSGSGKSELIKVIVHHYLKYNNAAVVIIDPKNDFAEQVAKWRENFNSDKLIYIDPDLSAQAVPVINPLELIRHPNAKEHEKNIGILSEQLVDALEQLLRGTSFSENMRGTLKYCLPVLIELEGATLHDLGRFMQDDSNGDLVELGRKSANLSTQQFFETFHSKALAPTKHAIYMKISSLLSNNVFAQVVASSKSTIDLEQALNEKKLVVFNLAKGAMGKDSSRAFGLFMVAMIQGIALRRAKLPKAQRVPVHTFIDESQNYISPSVEEILTESRAYGLHLTLASQVVGQKMDSTLKNILMKNTDIKVQGKGDEPPYSRLKTGDYFIKVGKSTEFRFSGLTHLLDCKNAMTVVQWEAEKQRQIDRYYKPLGSMNQAPLQAEDTVNDVPFESLKDKQQTKVREAMKEQQADGDTFKPAQD
ncbi:MAG: DUF87 domain-containing protein, partial [Nitrospinae bacterium]|nr:DUF87 domain-containing protein [Nitrospinota bacterium]